jgi:hypothetical protein
LALRGTEVSMAYETTNRTAALLVIVSFGFVLAACGSPKGAHPSSTGSTDAPTTGYRVVYKLSANGEDQGTITVLTDGGQRERMTVANGADVTTYVTDGKRLVSVYATEAPREESMEGFFGYVVHERDGTLARVCPAAKRTGVVTIVGRTATRFSCEPDSQASGLSEIAVDDQTGLVLGTNNAAEDRTTAVEVDVHATLPLDSFVVPATGASSSGFEFEPFSTAKVGGGTLALATYRGRKLLIISAGDAANLRTLGAGVVPVAASNGVTVLGLLRSLPPDGWSGSLLNPSDVDALARTLGSQLGTFDFPVGFDWKGGITAGLIQSAEILSPSDQYLIPIGSDGKRAASLRGVPSAADLAGALSTLK